MYQRIKDLREDKELLQKDIAKILKTTQQYYSDYEKGKRPIPTEKVITLAELYNTSTDYLLGLTNEIKPYPRIKKM